MRHFALGSVLLLVSAQLACARDINVTVGGPGGLIFNPPFVNAAEKDVIQFIFQQKNHSVRQSTFDNPCVLLKGGFDAPFMPVADNQTTFPTARLEVLKTTPIWAFCPQGNHCKAGMVFAVNPHNASEFAAFKAAAAASGASPSPSLRPSSTSTPTSVPSSVDHRILVGDNGALAFNPPNITADQGDTVTFEFRAKNHSITQSSFNSPCSPLILPSGNVGFDSGYTPVREGQGPDFPRFTVQVTSKEPIYAFCKQGKHCSQGMVFAVNAVESSSTNFDAFLALAKGSSSSSNSYPSPSSAAWRPGVGSSSKALVLGLSAAALLL